MTQALQDVVRKVELEYALDGAGMFLERYARLPSAKVTTYLEALQQIDQTIGALENILLERHEVERGALIFLGTLDVLSAERFREHDLPNLIEALAHAHSLEAEALRQRVLAGFVVTSLTLFKHFPDRPEILNEKVIIGELHDRGAFLPGVWGVTLNFDIFTEVIERFRFASAEKIDKLRKRYAPVRLGELVMLSRLAA